MNEMRDWNSCDMAPCKREHINSANGMEQSAYDCAIGTAGFIPCTYGIERRTEEFAGTTRQLTNPARGVVPETLGSVRGYLGIALRPDAVCRRPSNVPVPANGRPLHCNNLVQVVRM